MNSPQCATISRQRASWRIPMYSRREPARRLAFLLNSVDRFGRTIEPCVLAVAQDIAPRAVPYGERFLGDPALSITLFEEAAAKVSHAVRQKALTGQPEIREMRRYLFRAYLSRLADERPKTLHQRCICQIPWSTRPHDFESRSIERRVLVQELLNRCDRVTQEIFHRRLQGWSWKEIEQGCGIPANAASLRFSRAVRHFQRDASGERTPSVLASERQDAQEIRSHIPDRGDPASALKGRARKRFSKP
jgi:DNA-directed RNA polymerase specialized sigma24 family protein